MNSATPPLARRIALGLLTLLLAGCTDEDKIVVENTTPSQSNRPPTIIKYGPDMPAGGFEVVSSIGQGGITLWAVIGDPDGVDDVIFVGADIDSVRLNRFIVRPDTSSGSCLMFSYAPGDTIATALMAVPASLPGQELRPLVRVQGGYFLAEAFGPFPDFLDLSPALEQWPGGCTSGSYTALVGPIIVTPPAVASNRAAIISYVDLDYYGITISVFDASGATASVELPTWHVVYTTPDERTSLP